MVGIPVYDEGRKKKAADAYACICMRMREREKRTGGREGRHSEAEVVCVCVCVSMCRVCMHACVHPVYAWRDTLCALSLTSVTESDQHAPAIVGNKDSLGPLKLRPAE